MAEEATKTPLDDFKERLADAKNQRKIAEGGLSKAKRDLVEVRRGYPEKIATAKNTLWHARETRREKRKERKRLDRRRRTLHRQRRWNEAAQTKFDAWIEKMQDAVTKIEARIKDEEERRKRLNREGQGAINTAPPTENQDRLLKWHLSWTRWTAERLGKGTRWLGKSRKRIENEQKDVGNLPEDKEREEQAAIKDVEKKRKELDTLKDVRKKEERQGEDHIRKARKNVREKRRAVRMAASDVNSEALKFPWKRIADNIVEFGRQAGFAGVAGCFYASAVSLGAIFQFFYFHLNGVNIFSYAESVDFLAPGYALVAFFILTAVSGSLIPLAFYPFVKWIAIRPLYAERVVGILRFFAKRIPKTLPFVLYCTVCLLFSPPVAAVVRYNIWPPSQDVVWIVTDAPFQHEEKYIRVGSTSKYLFLKKFTEKEEPADGQTSSGKNTWFQVIKTWPGIAWAWLQTINTWPGTAWAGLQKNLRAGDEGEPDPILIVPLSQITCISETTGNGEGLCRPAAVKSPPPAEDPVDQHIVGDMRCRAGTELVTSDFVPFVYNKGDEIAECAGTQPRSKEEWEEEIRRFVRDKNNKERKWRVYGLASLDGDSAENDDLSRQRAETVRDMLCTVSKTWSSIKECQEKVEIRYLGENNLVTAGPKSRSAVIAVCERVPEQNPGKTTTPARKVGAPGV